MADLKHTKRPFPIHPGSVRRHPDLPKCVPWDFVAPFEAQAYRNHSQSLKLLASRGGLNWCELEAVVTGKSLDQIGRDERASAKTVLAMLAALSTDTKDGGAS